MKIKIKPEQILNCIFPLQSVITNGNIIPILKCVKIDFTKDSIIFTGDNLQVRCSNSLNLNPGFETSICIDFQLLLTSLRSINKSEIVDLSIDKNTLRINHEKGKFDIPIEDFKQFPNPKIEDIQSKSTIKTKDFKKALKVSTKFLLNNELDPMDNLSIEIGSKSTKFRSTNKTSLYFEKIKGGGDKSNLLLSGSAASAIHSLIEDESDEVEIRYNESMVFFNFGNKQVSVVQQEGEFPIPQFDRILLNIEDDAYKIEMIYDEFFKSLKRVSALADRKAPQVKISLSKKSMNLVCKNDLLSTNVEENLSVKFKGGEKVIGFNPKLLTEIISVFDAKCDMSINSHNQFCLETKNTKGLLAPMVLND